jgi:1,2-diacylglycerol 3-alpha-glucosyltransferase
MVRLVYFTTGLAPFEVGGVATVASGLIHELVKNKSLELSLVANTSASETDVSAQFGNRLEKVIKLKPLEPLGYDISKTKGLWKVLNNCDLVHVNDFYAVRHSYLPFFAHFRRKPLLYSYHGQIWEEILDYFVGERFGGVKTYIEKAFFNLHKGLWDVIVVNSRYSKMYATSVERFDTERIKVIPHGFDADVVRRTEPVDLNGEVKLLYTGGMRRRKRFDMILEAISLMSPEARKRAILYVAGYRSRESQEFEELTTRLGIGDHVKFLGPLPLTVCYRLYKSCNIYVTACPRESFGMSVLEALAFGLPVVAIRAGATPELIRDQRNGFLVSPSASEIARRVEFLVDNPELRLQMSKNNMADAGWFSWSRAAASYADLYQSLAR